MKNPFKDIQNFYFLGIGGIGMSALARYFVLSGKAVAGYDRTASEITHQLIAEGIQLNFNDVVEEIPSVFKNPKKTLVIFTPAVSAENQLYVFFKQEGFAIKKRAEVLGMITKGIPTLAVAGTHGKTTTTAILAHILKQSGVKITAFLGGISENYQSNFIGDGKEAIVVEADEFDRSFLQLSPAIAAITSMDADHLDIYGTEQELINSFHQFVAKLPAKDNLIFKKGLPLEGETLSIEEKADYEIKNIRVEEGSYRFSFKTPTEIIENIYFGLPGKHNLINAGMALAIGLKFGIASAKLSAALSSFKGVDRRFTYHLKTPKKILIEDYAHHPKEIEAVYQAIKEMHPLKRNLAVFQPHLYSRTKDFADAFAESLQVFDEVILMEIYPAREEPIPGITSEMLLGKIKNSTKQLIARAQLQAAVKKSKAEVIVLMGAGDIGNEVETIKTMLLHEN